jgi:hypothetical protein
LGRRMADYYLPLTAGFLHTPCGVPPHTAILLSKPALMLCLVNPQQSSVCLLRADIACPSNIPAVASWSWNYCIADQYVNELTERSKNESNRIYSASLIQVF